MNTFNLMDTISLIVHLWHPQIRIHWMKLPSQSIKKTRSFGAVGPLGVESVPAAECWPLSGPPGETQAPHPLRRPPTSVLEEIRGSIYAAFSKTVFCIPCIKHVLWPLAGQTPWLLLRPEVVVCSSPLTTITMHFRVRRGEHSVSEEGRKPSAKRTVAWFRTSSSGTYPVSPRCRHCHICILEICKMGETIFTHSELYTTTISNTVNYMHILQSCQGTIPLICPCILHPKKRNRDLHEK